MLYFSVIMLVLAIMAMFTGPVLKRTSVLWFFLGWLPGELPWLFAGLQLSGVSLLFLIGDPSFFSLVVSLALTALSMVIWIKLHNKTLSAGPIFASALQKILDANIDMQCAHETRVQSPPVIQKREWLRPFSYKREGVERLRDISYGASKRNRLDIYRQKSANADDPTSKLPCPVLLHVHGGAWVLGNKHQQALPLINYLAQNGWVCVDINYRLAHKDPFPACVIDVKKAIAWIKENIANYGGDPNFVAITGESAGGHLCALAALTANTPDLQPGFEQCDTRVQAAVPVYGVYDFTNHQRDGLLMRRFLEKYVMPSAFTADEIMWRNASPVLQSNTVNVPMLIIHGDKDCVVPVQQAREFAQQQQQSNTAPVIYVELPGAQHGFDVFHSIRTEFHIEAVGKFLRYCYCNLTHGDRTHDNRAK